MTGEEFDGGEHFLATGRTTASTSPAWHTGERVSHLLSPACTRLLKTTTSALRTPSRGGARARTFGNAKSVSPISSTIRRSCGSYPNNAQSAAERRRAHKRQLKGLSEPQDQHVTAELAARETQALNRAHHVSRPSGQATTKMAVTRSAAAHSTRRVRIGIDRLLVPRHAGRTENPK